MHDVLIVGAGLTGVVCAERIASAGGKVLIIDKRNHIGGNCYDYREKGVTIHKYGPHVFHTNSKTVWDYLSRFTAWQPFMYEVLACVDGILIPIPFNFNSLYMVFPPQMAAGLEQRLTEAFEYGQKVPISDLMTANPDLAFLSDYIYEKIFKHYTLKQWGMGLDELDPSIGGRVPVSISRDNRYFTDTYQAIPQQGYTAMIMNIANHPNITLQLNTDFAEIKDNGRYAKLIYTGSIDEFFAYKYGQLPYRSLRFDFVAYEQPYYQCGPQVNYPCNYDFTRIAEYKYYLNEQSDSTIVSFEYPEQFVPGANERYYPIIKAENQALYEKYLAEAAALKDTYFLGRLGDYKYYNMDQAVERALALFNKL